MRKQLNIGHGAFARIAEDLRVGSERQCCILLDQFEELFRFVEEIGPDEAEIFAAIICGFAAGRQTEFIWSSPSDRIIRVISHSFRISQKSSTVARKWWQRRALTPAWASRYAGDFEHAALLMSRTKRRLAWRWAAMIATGLVIIALPIAGGYWRVISARDQAQEQFASAQNARAMSLASIGEQVLARDGATRGLLVAIEGLKSSGGPSVAQCPAQPMHGLGLCKGGRSSGGQNGSEAAGSRCDGTGSG